jgi:hypothetical protein
MKPQDEQILNLIIDELGLFFSHSAEEDIKMIADKYHKKQLLLYNVINWVACKDIKPVDGKEYLISDGEDVTEAQWYDDSKWGGEPYDSYTHYAEKPKPPCL